MGDDVTEDEYQDELFHAMGKRHPDKPFYIAWVACDCYIWPISLEDGFGKCGFCGVTPYEQVPEPPSGKVTPKGNYGR